jgi:hypothetical protein
MPDGGFNTDPLNTVPLNTASEDDPGGTPPPDGPADLAAMASQVFICDPSWNGSGF